MESEVAKENQKCMEQESLWMAEFYRFLKS